MALESYKAHEATYFRLQISCPVCLDQGKHTPKVYWVHAGDSGPIFIGDNAHYHCMKCDHHSHVKEWRHGCATHGGELKCGEMEYAKDSSQGLPQAVSVGGQLVTTTGSQWLIRFLENVGEF